MIAVDTNILVRYAVKDDRAQAVAATEFLRNNRCYLLRTVILETVWVLASASGYGLPRQAVVERIRHICGLPTITVETPLQLAQALSWYEQGMDFADALHLASSSSCNGFATMDRRLVEKATPLITEPALILVR